MRAEALIVAGGVANLLGVGFHLAFWKLFDWRRDLASLSPINRQVMQLLNIALCCVFALFAVLSFAFPEELHQTLMGRTILVGVVSLFAVRAVAGVILGGLRRWWQIAILGAIALIVALYSLPLLL